MNEKEPGSPNGQDDSGEGQEEQTPRQRSAWSKAEAERAQLKRDLDQARQAAAGFQGLQQQNAQLQERLRQVELQQRTAGLPDEQRGLAVLQSQLEDALRKNEEIQRNASSERDGLTSVLGPMARKQVAISMIEEYDLPSRIETPTGTEKMSEYLMYHREGQTPEGMDALAKKIAANFKKSGTTSSGVAKAPASGGKFLGAGGGGSPTTAKSVDKMTFDDIRGIRALIKDENLSWAEARQRYSANEK